MTYKSTVALCTLLIGLIIGGQTLTNTDAEPLPDATTQLGILDTVLKQNEHQDNVLANHEARITNTENDVSQLQGNTTIVERVEVPVVVTQPVPTPEAPAPEPEPVVVTAYEQVPVSGTEDIDCKYTYSDGTTYQWHWFTVEYNQGSRITHRSGICDDRAIGTNKPI